MFSDRARIHVQAGKGGDGGLSFRREKYVPKGGPDGGDGGNGGDVVLVADPALRDLSALQRRRLIKAGRGGNGRGARKHGADGDDVEVGVPVGTQVFSDTGDLIADLDRRGARVVLARGGHGGRGNARFATPTRQVPRFAEVGLPGGEQDVELHLKLLADAALVGLPNAGKSSLLTRISNARPKVADYPFTTLQPVLGTVETDSRQIVVADVPGLIEGASEGIGLGDEFLAHLERARTLVHVIDASRPADEQWRTIDAELEAYGAGLDQRPQIVVLNKIDLEPEPAFEVDDPRIVAVFRLSCATGRGLDEFRRSLATLVPAPEPEERSPDELADHLVYRPEPKQRTWRLLRTDGGYRVVGTPPSDDELERALKAAGARKGATVEVGDEELELG